MVTGKFSWQLRLVFKVLDVQDWHRVIAVITGFILLPMSQWLSVILGCELLASFVLGS